MMDGAASFVRAASAENVTNYVIGTNISARMSSNLHAHMRGVVEAGWQILVGD